MTGDPCEGGCGCRLSSLGYRGAGPELWEWVLDEHGLESVLHEPHTPARCLAIRVLRDAAQDAAGPDGEAVVGVGFRTYAVFLIRARSGDRWAEVPCAVAWVIGQPREVLDEAANLACGRLRALLAAPVSERPWPGAVIARDPR